MFGEAKGLFGVFPVLSTMAVACAVIAAAILVWYLLRRPPLNGMVKLILLLGIGVLPLGTAMTGNLAGFEHTMNREFCGSCHVMTPFLDDAMDPESTSLPARHTRNDLFGGQSCYTCHADYGMFGTIMTKWGGMHHVWEYYLNYLEMPVDEALPIIETYEPYPNANCMHCHSTEVPNFLAVPDHRSALREMRAGAQSCASAGCHGPAHSFAGPDSHETARDDAEEPAPTKEGATEEVSP